MIRKSPAFAFVAVAAFALLAPPPAWAYVDPGTGSVLTATILGLFGAVAYTFRKYLYKIQDLFTGRKSSPGEDQSPRKPS